MAGKPCHQGSTPPYGITISSAQDASDIVKWATAHSVKLTIKNTGVIYYNLASRPSRDQSCSQGHDYLGRSSGPSSLQVSTHHLSGVTYVVDFVPQGSSVAPVPALKIGAGAQLEASEPAFLFTRILSYGCDFLRLVYSVMGANNVSAVLGSCLTVGAGEWHVFFTLPSSALDQRGALSREGVSVCEWRLSLSVSFGAHICIISDSLRHTGLL